MIDKVFFDTNLIIYLFDLKDLIKRDKIKRLLHELIGKSHLIISVQVINELFIISPLNFLTSTNALKIKNKYKFSLWDSLIIASALENNCNILYTEDLQNNQTINSKLTIINPFI